ncbi:MAG: transposase [Holosporaceae bacterium]|jgi:transposase|nr:transposase [Holosporaceae bacterium]
MNAYSTDLRARVIEYVENGHTQRESAARFGVSDRTVWAWVKLLLPMSQPRFIML